MREPAHYILNLAASHGPQALPREQAIVLLRRGMWEIDAREPHRDALAQGDLALVYVGAPQREFIGRAELASRARWAPGGPIAGVLLTDVEEWDPPVPMSLVLAEIDSPTARADFDAGVVRIHPREYEAALAVAARLRG